MVCPPSIECRGCCLANASDTATKSAPHLPKAALARLTKAYEDATIILEYGSGGSTELAAALPGKYVMSVESDADWARNLREKIHGSRPRSYVAVHHVDIGKTGEWGRALTDRDWRNFHRYPNDIWDQSFFRHPEVVLIDGRFRTACLVTILLRATKPVTVLFDDYTDRPKYRAVERIIKPICLHDRMAEFEVQPGVTKSEDVSFLIAQYFQATIHGAVSYKQDK